MRAKIIRRWAIFIAVLSLIGGTGFFTQQLQITRQAKSVDSKADTAVKEGDFATAEALYREHLVVFPDDVEIKIKYADALLKADPSPKRQDEALQVYAGILKGHAGRADVRRKQMQVQIDKGNFPAAEADLRILLARNEDKNDGHLMFLMGQCCEASRRAPQPEDRSKEAVDWYRSAIEHHAPEQIDAYQQLATLLRGSLNKPDDADQAIEAMVQAAPKNYLVYLARGRYLHQLGSPKCAADFQKAQELAEDSPEVYLETARAAATYDAARQILELGLTKAPASAIYLALAELERRNGHPDQAIKTLERGLELSTDKSRLRMTLAEILAARGETGTLLLQIEALKKIGYNPYLVQYLTAYYHINASEFSKALQLLIPLESRPGVPPQFKAQLNNMLAQCYGQLGEPARQQEAYGRALAASPQDITAKIGVIERMEKQGEFEAAIKEYRLLLKQYPRVSFPLARLLLNRNRQRPAPKRDWDEVKQLIDAVEKSFPTAVDPLILRAEFYLAQDKNAEARNELEQAQSRFPENIAIRCAQANLMVLQKQFGESRNLLDQVQKQLGDSLELRLQRARLAVAQGGPQVVNELNVLGQNLEPFSKEQRRKLLSGLATEFQRLQDLAGASRVWTRLAEEEPNDLDVRLKLLDVAFQNGSSSEIEKYIKQIEQMDGIDEFVSRCCQVQYLIWQAERAAKEPQEALRLRTKARVLLTELASQRADSSFIPMFLAQLEQQELRQGAPDDEIQAKEENIIGFYRRAIDLGERRPDVMRQTVKLLFKHKRGSEALDLLRAIPVESQLAGDLEHRAIALAFESRDFERAEEIARRAVATKPTDFQERLSLARILLASGRPSESETVIREAIGLSKTDPDRWIALVDLLLLNKHPVEAAKAVKDAEASLPQPQAPLALAQCCEMLGKFYEGTDEDKKKQWYAQAKGWYEKAQAAHPDDLSVTRRITEFYLQTKQLGQVEAQLNAILKGGSKSQSAGTVAWAKRALALTLASDPKRVRDALSILEPAGQAGPGAKTLEDPAELRVLAKVLAEQNTVHHRERAIKLLESAVDRNLASAEDRFLLAQLDEISGDWPKALKVYRELIFRTKNPRDLETLRQRPVYLAWFASSLLRYHKAGDDQDLIDAETLVDELKQLQPDQLRTLVLQVRIYQARNQLDKAVDLIQTSAKRPGLAPIAVASLAELAERKLGRFDVAEPLYRQYAALLNPRDGAMVQALFLGRNGRVKEALDLCEPLWANPQNVEKVAGLCVEVVTSSNNPPDQVQLDRVAGWLEQALKQNKDSTLLLAALGNCRERQTRYDDAKTLYESVIKQGPGRAGASSKMIANSYNNLAWLLALTGDQGKDALVDIDRAIKLEGELPDYLDTRGIVYLNLKRTHDAINDLEKAVKADPSPSRLFHLTQAYLQANNKESAKRVWKNALDKKLDQIRFGPRGLHPLEQLAYQKVRGELGSP